MGWYRVGDASSADWSVRRRGTQHPGSGGSMPPLEGYGADPHGMVRPSGITSGSRSLRSLRSVLENRDLCRIVSSYIPTPSMQGKYLNTSTCIHHLCFIDQCNLRPIDKHILLFNFNPSSHCCRVIEVLGISFKSRYSLIISSNLQNNFRVCFLITTV
jgi:hypothetical protein